ncbi:MAG: DUF2817 domain-containing protein [Clostridiales bacterium]|nr:DUF2817 domain-containing protein [Clostridiales bacterium]
MANWLIRQTVDLEKIRTGGVPFRDVEALAFQEDREAHRWEVTVLRGGVEADLTDYTVAAYFHRSGDGDGESVLVTGTIIGSVCRAVLPEACYAYEGRVEAIMRLTAPGGAKTTLSAVGFSVGRTMTGAVIDPGEAIPSIDNLLNRMEALTDLTNRSQALVEHYEDSVLELGRDVFGRVTDPKSLTWASGSFAAATGRINANAAYIHTPDFMRVRKGSSVTVTDLASYRFQCMWYATDAESGFDAGNSKAAGVREKYVVPEDGYLRISIRDDSQSSLTDNAICQYVVLDLIDGDSVEALRETVKADGYDLTDSFAAEHGLTTYDARAIDWTEGYRLETGTGEMIATTQNRVSVVAFTACKAGSRIRLRDRQYQMNICSYSGITASSKRGSATGLTQEDWVAEEDCFFRITVRKAWDGAITAAEAKAAVEMTLFTDDTPSFTHGSISGTTGEDIEASGNRMRCGMWYLKKGTVLTPGADFPCYVRRYASNSVSSFMDLGGAGNTDSGSVNITSALPYTVPTDGWYRFVATCEDVYDLHCSDVFTVAEAAEEEIAAQAMAFPPSDIYRYEGEDIDLTLLPRSCANRYATLIGWYEALRTQYPGFVTRTQIGTDQTGTYPIWAYKIESYACDAHETVLWVSNIHGGENFCLTATYRMVKELLDNHATDENLAHIWAQGRLVVVPALNPWGVENNTRYNGNLVDLNRNYDADWKSGHDTSEGVEYTFGTAPMSEAENQALESLLETYPDALFCVNRHDCAYFGDKPSVTIYTSDAFDIDRTVLDAMARRFEIYLRKQYAWWRQYYADNATRALIANNATTVNAAVMDKWFNMLGVHGCLLETPRTNDTPERQQDCVRFGLEVSVNLLSAVLTNARLIRANGNKLTHVYWRREQYPRNE